MTSPVATMQAEAIAARLTLAWDADDYAAYQLALASAHSFEVMNALIATLVNTVVTSFEPYTGWQERTSAQLVGLLDELAEVQP